MGNDKLNFIKDNINLLSYEYNKEEMDNIEKMLNLNINKFHPEDTKNTVQQANLISNCVSFYIKDIYPYKDVLGGGIKLDPDISIMNPFKNLNDDYSLLESNTNNFLKYIRTIYPESISRIAWGQDNSKGLILKDLFPDIKTNFNFFDSGKSRVMDKLSENYYIAPLNLTMLKNFIFLLRDPEFKVNVDDIRKDFYLMSPFIKTIFDGSENLLNRPEDKRFLKNIHKTVNITSSEEDRELIKNVLSNYIEKKPYENELLELIEKNKSNPKYQVYKNDDKTTLNEMFKYINPLKFIYSLEIEGENIKNENTLGETIMKFEEYKKLNLFTRDFIEKLNYVFAVYDQNGTTYTYPLCDTIEKIKDIDNIKNISIIPIPYDNNVTMFSFFKNLKNEYDQKMDTERKNPKINLVKKTQNNFGLNKLGSMIFIDSLTKCKEPHQVLFIYIDLRKKYKNETESVFDTIDEKKNFTQYLLTKLNYKVKYQKAIRFNKEYTKLIVTPQPSIQHFKSLFSVNEYKDLTYLLKECEPLLNFINSFEFYDKGGNKTHEENNLLFEDDFYDPIALVSGIDKDEINRYFDDYEGKLNFFKGEHDMFEEDLNELYETNNLNTNTLSDIVPLNIYFKRELNKDLFKKIENSGGDKVYENIKEFLNEIIDVKNHDVKNNIGGFKPVYDNINELMEEIRGDEDYKEDSRIRQILSNILSTNDLSMYDINGIKRKIYIMNNSNRSYEQREISRLLMNLSNMISKYKFLKKTGIVFDKLGDETFATTLIFMINSCLDFYQIINILDLTRNFLSILSAYNINIINKEISYEDIKNIDKYFLKNTLSYKYKMYIKRCKDFLKNSGLGLDESIIDRVDKNLTFTIDN